MLLDLKIHTYHVIHGSGLAAQTIGHFTNLSLAAESGYHFARSKKLDKSKVRVCHNDEFHSLDTFDFFNHQGIVRFNGEKAKVQ